MDGLPPTGGARKLARQEGFEPPTRGFGDRCSTVGATGVQVLLRLLVLRVLPAALAELAEHQPIGLSPLVPIGGVVPLLAHRALERHDRPIAHLLNLWLPASILSNRTRDAAARKPPFIELPGGERKNRRRAAIHSRRRDHSMISVTTPAPTVRPPSRIANRS